MILCRGTALGTCSGQKEAAGMPGHLQRLQLADQGYEGLWRLRVQHSVCIHLELCLEDGLDAVEAYLHGHPSSADGAGISALSPTSEGSVCIELPVRVPGCQRLKLLASRQTNLVGGRNLWALQRLKADKAHQSCQSCVQLLCYMTPGNET